MTKLRILMIPASLVAVVMTSAVARADRKKHEEKYCSALSAVSADLAKLDAIGPTSTLSELREDVAQIDKDTKTVDREARKIRTATSREFVQAAEKLYKEMQSLPNSLTIEEARSRIDDDLQIVKRTGRALANESGCPEAMPEQRSAGSAT